MAEINPSQRPVFPSYVHPIDNARWTTARCLRLLRPITARVKKLRKDRENFLQLGFGTERQQTAAAGPTRGCKFKATGGPSNQSDDDRDPEWILPQQASYGRRSKTTGAALSQPKCVSGRVSVSTLVIARALECNDLARLGPGTTGVNTDSEDKLSPQDLGKQLSRYTLRLKQLRKKTDHSTWQLYGSLCHGLEALLKATAAPENFYVKPSGETRERAGARSLLSMCLRRIPEYIENQETLSATERLDDHDLSSAVYSEIEEMGYCEKGGWRGLREMVRSHGIRILSKAIEDGVICEDLGELLVWISVDKGAYDEAEAIISAMLSVAALTWPTTTDISIVSRPTCLPVHLLFSFTRITQRFSFRFRELEQLFRSGCLCKEWLAHDDFSEVWQAAIQALSEQNSHVPSAVNFVTTALELTLGIPRLGSANRRSSEISDSQAAWMQRFEKTLDNTVYSVTTVLASMAVLNQRFFELTRNSQYVASNEVTPALYLVQILCTDILGALETSQEASGWVCQAAGVSRRTLPALLSGLLILPSFDENLCGTKGASIAKGITEVMSFWRRQKHSSFQTSNQRAIAIASGNTSKAVDHLSYYINSLSECCAKATQDGGFEHITYFTKRLQSILDSSSVRQQLGFEDRCNLAQIVLESAYEFADRDRKMEHFEWAEGIDKWMVREGHTKATMAPGKTHRPQQPNPWHFGISTASPQLARKCSIPLHVGFKKLRPKLSRNPKRQRDDAESSDDQAANYSESGDSLPSNKKRRHRKNQVPQLAQTPRISSIVSPLRETPWNRSGPTIVSSPTDELSRMKSYGSRGLFSFPLRRDHKNKRAHEKTILRHSAINANAFTEVTKRSAWVGKENASSDVDELSLTRHQDVEKSRPKIVVRELIGRELKKTEVKESEFSMGHGPLAELARVERRVTRRELMKPGKLKELKQPRMSYILRTVKPNGALYRIGGHRRVKRDFEVLSEDELLG